MSRRQIERRLRDAGGRLKSLREELAIGEEQLLHLAELADDARLRALVSETPVSEREHTEAERHADAMRRRQEEIRREIATLEQQQDDLLDRLSQER